MNRRRNTIAGLVLIAAVGLAALAGCSSPKSAGNPLNGTQWRLTGWTLSSIDPAAVKITLQFAEGKVSGNSGVNSYGGSFTTGPGNAFAVGAIAMTEMAGSDLNMRAESAFQTLLGQARSYKLAGSTLTLYDQGGNESLSFEATGK